MFHFFTAPAHRVTMGRGILLSGVRRQQQYHSQSDKQSHDQMSHGRTPFPACAAPSAGSRVKRSNRAVRVIAYPSPPGNTGCRWNIIAIERLDVPAFRVFRDVSAPVPFPRPSCIRRNVDTGATAVVKKAESPREGSLPFMCVTYRVRRVPHGRRVLPATRPSSRVPAPGQDLARYRCRVLICT